MDDIQIWKAADEMIFAYGEDADLHAAMRAELATDRGDFANKHLWCLVTQAILDLERHKPKASDFMN